METKVLKAGDFVIQYFVLITSFSFWPIENQTMGWQGILIYVCYKEMFRQKGWGVLKNVSLKTATDLNHHDLKLETVRANEHISFNSKWMREIEEKSKSGIWA